MCRRTAGLAPGQKKENHALGLELQCAVDGGIQQIISVEARKGSRKSTDCPGQHMNKVPVQVTRTRPAGNPEIMVNGVMKPSLPPVSPPAHNAPVRRCDRAGR